MTNTPPRKHLDNVIASQVEMKPVEWVWRNRLARGKLTLITGDPEMGKSMIGFDIIARLTRGSTWPDGEKAQMGKAVILSAEDAEDDTIVPRLIAAGANLDQIKIIKGMTDTSGKKRSFNLQHDLQDLANELVDDVVCMMIDPITAYMGDGVDSHRTSDVRAVLSGLDKFAKDHKVAVLGITHPTKAMQHKAMNAFTGSLAYVAASRLAFIALEDTELERKLFLPVKNNIGLRASGLGYRIIGVTLSNGLETAHVDWDGEPVSISADKALRELNEEGKKPHASELAEEFIKGFLKDGPKTVNEMNEAAKGLKQFSPRTLARARKKLGIEPEKEGMFGPWLVRLPTKH